MYKLTLRLYKEQFRQLVLFIPDPGQVSKHEAINESLESLVLLEWRAKLTRLQILTWSQRDNRKLYALNLPLSVAIALWSCLQINHLTNELQMLATELDSALVNAGLKTQSLNPYHHV